ncbi:hypothetical protein NLG97_g10448 [Lecanicillium saksenae]|uniref:Uncharacterized protein n=1 Tax=Lecanicillium saksenae TaxID=468837 RepID=A0ACC1QFW4_9HYPO|nr:hypothetical protein NLG97_g10448 [Lecanicillium saksenae]
MDSSYVNAAGQTNVWEYKLKAEFVSASLKPTLARQNLLVLEEAGEAISMVLWQLGDAASRGDGRAAGLGLGGSILENVNVAVESDNEMCDADGLENGNVDVAADGIAGAVGLVRFVGSDVEVEDVAIAGANVEGGQVDA